ncbi:MAG: carboxypeptidase regulatory-like domain-containing protein [Armatimonadota bacterium]|nr:carboxypeptidase regulatory-like domain-containing protein [Armatimonadota bacterium]
MRRSRRPCRAGAAALLSIVMVTVALAWGCGGLPPMEEGQGQGAVVVMVVEEETNEPLEVPATVIVGGVRGTLKPSDEQLVLRDVPLGTGTPPTQPMTVTAAGYVTRTQQVQLSITTATWVTATVQAADTAITGTVSGTVSDVETEEPVVNAFVQFTPPDAAEPLVAGYTDNDGAFIIGGIPEGERQVTVEAGGYLPRSEVVKITADDDGENEPLEVTLVAGDTTVTVTGVVVDVLTRQPIADAEVSIAELDPVTTGADGRFEVADVPVGDQPAKATAQGYEEFAGTVTVLPGMGDLVIELFERAEDPPGAPFTLAGTVTLSGAPDNSGAQVTAVDIDAALAADSQVTGPSGRYELFVPPGRYEVRVVVGERSLAREVTVPPGGVVVDGIDFVLTVE